MRTRQFKIRLTDAEMEQLHRTAKEQNVSAADLVRYRLFGPDNCRRLPSHKVLRDILRQLSGIATNINQAAHKINSAETKGILSKEEFKGMLQALGVGHKAWVKPKEDLAEQLGLAPRKDRPAE